MKKNLTLLALVTSTQLWAVSFRIINNSTCDIDFVGSKESTNVIEHNAPDHIGAYSKGTVKFTGDGALRFREIFAVSCVNQQPDYIVNQVSYLDKNNYSGSMHIACAPTDDFIDCDHTVSGKVRVGYLNNSLDIVVSSR